MKENKDNLSEGMNKSMMASKKFRMILIGLFLVTGTGVGMAFMFPQAIDRVFDTYCIAVTTLILGYVGVEGTSDAMVKKKIAEKRGDALVVEKSKPASIPSEPGLEPIGRADIPVESVVHRVHRGSPPPLRGHE